MKEIKDMTGAEREQAGYTALETIICNLATVALALKHRLGHEGEKRIANIDQLEEMRRQVGNMFLSLHFQLLDEGVDIKTFSGKSVGEKK